MNNEHYRGSGLQPIDAITAWNLSYNTGTALAYIARHLRKGKPAEDLTKAIWHLVHELTEDTDVCDAIVAIVEDETVVEWVDESSVPEPSFVECSGTPGARYAVVTDGLMIYETGDYQDGLEHYSKVSNRFHCNRASLIDRGPVGNEAREIEVWINDEVFSPEVDSE